MEAVDITSDELRDQGYSLKKEGPTVALYFDGSCKRSALYKEDWNKTIRQMEKMLADGAISQKIISDVLSCMSFNYPKLMNGSSSLSSSSTTSTEAQQIRLIELTEEITKEVSFEHIADILSTSIKKDKAPKLITFCGMLLSQTNEDQLNIGYQAESSSGKSYIPLEVSTYFPREEIEEIASASPTAFYHDGGTWDDEKRALICDLKHKNLIFMDMPGFQLLEKLRPMLSHDRDELRYKITDKNQKYGLRTKNVIIRGYPSVFFCSTKTDPDEQEKTRMLLLSPQTDQEKLREALELAALRKSNPEEYRKRILQDPKRAWLTDRISSIRQWGIREIIIPEDGKAVYDRFMKEHQYLMPRHQRDFPRIFSFIKAHALLNCFNRKKLEGDMTAIVATQSDIDAGFALYKEIEQSNELGLSPYVFNIYQEVVAPLLDPNIGVLREDILKKYYEVRHKTLSPQTLKADIIPQLEAVGLIRQEADKEDRRRMLVYPTVSNYISSPSNEEEEEEGRNVDQDSEVNYSSLFWKTYDKLENQKQSEADGTVKESELKQALISSGKFNAGEAAQIVKDMIDNGKLTRSGFDVLYKKQ
jgi:hypothetical protein